MIFSFQNKFNSGGFLCPSEKKLWTCNSTILLSIIFILFTAPAGLCENSDDLSLVTNNFPPYSFIDDGSLSGIAVDIVKELAKMTGHSGEIIVLPWKRALRYSDEMRILLFPYARRPYRENHFKWIGSIISDTLVFVVHRSDKRTFNHIEDFRTLGVGVVTSTPAAYRLNKLGFERMEIVPEERLNALKLLSRSRIDAWYSPYLILTHILQSEGFGLEEIKVAYKDIDLEMYIAASLKVPDETVSLWRHNLNEIKKNGKYQHILNESGFHLTPP